MVGVRFLRRVGLRSGALFLSVLTPGLVAQASRPAGYRPPPHLAGEDEPLRRVEQGLRDAARARTASALRATVQGILAAGAAERSAVDLERLQLVAGWAQRLDQPALARLALRAVLEAREAAAPVDAAAVAAARAACTQAEQTAEFAHWLDDAGAPTEARRTDDAAAAWQLRQSLALARRVAGLRAEVSWLLTEAVQSLLPALPSDPAAADREALTRMLARLRLPAGPLPAAAALRPLFLDAEPWPLLATQAQMLFERLCTQRRGTTAAVGPVVAAQVAALRAVPRALAEARHKEAGMRKNADPGFLALCAVDASLGWAGDGDDARALAALDKALKALGSYPGISVEDRTSVALCLGDLKLRRKDRKGAIAAYQALARRDDISPALRNTVRERQLMAFVADGQQAAARAAAREQVVRQVDPEALARWALLLSQPARDEWGLGDDAPATAQLLGLSATPADELDALDFVLEQRSRHYRAMRAREWLLHTARQDAELAGLLESARERRRQWLMALISGDQERIARHDQKFEFADALRQRFAAAPEPKPLVAARRLDDLTARLPQQSVALLVTESFSPKDGQTGYRALLWAGGSVRGFDLGPKPVVQAAVLAHRQALMASIDSEPTGLPAALAGLLQPVIAAIPDDTTTVFVLPQGPLAAVPWETVPGVAGRGGAPRTVQYLLCLDALDARPPRSGSSAMLALGGAEFGLAGPLDPAGREPPFDVPVTTGFAPLPAGASEANQVWEVFKRIHPKVSGWLFTNQHATRTAALGTLGQVRWMHLGTHLFHGAETPRSGLVFAGATQADVRERSRAVLLAAQLANQEMHNCELVVLPHGDALLGSDDHLLRLVRALHTAGVRNVVTTLWPVPDAARIRFVTLLWERVCAGKLTLPQALDATRAAARKDGLGPGVWAAFVHYANG